jgi:hypothetical protein
VCFLTCFCPSKIELTGFKGCLISIHTHSHYLCHLDSLLLSNLLFCSFIGCYQGHLHDNKLLESNVKCGPIVMCSYYPISMCLEICMKTYTFMLQYELFCQKKIHTLTISQIRVKSGYSLGYNFCFRK